jgi:PAS domain S-box-containing protein
MEKKKVLIVEDESIIALSMQAMLTRMGYDVPPPLASGEDALASIDRTRPDIVLVDIVLKGAMNGIDAARLIRDQYDIPVVYVTAYSDRDTLDRAKKTGSFGYLLKPFDEKTLYATIEVSLYKHWAERLLRESEEKYRMLFENSQISTAITRFNGSVVAGNRAFFEITGYAPEEMNTINLGSIYRDESDRDALMKLVEMHGRVRKYEIYVKRRNGEPYTAVVNVDRTRMEGEDVLLVTAVDITEQRRAEEELRNSREQLRALAVHLQQVREEERTKIAREVHDEFGQVLTGLKIDLSLLAAGLTGQGGVPEKANLLERIVGMTKLIDSTIRNIRRLVTELRPGVLDDLGLVAAIEWQLQEFSDRTGIQGRLDSGPEEDESVMDSEVSTAFFRIFQEALTNVARHSEATEVQVYLRDEGGIFVMEVRDNGKGIEQENIFASNSLGLLGIRERVLSVGGECAFTGSPGKGTMVRVRVPAWKRQK